MKFAFIGFLFAVAMVNAASVWERSPWDTSPTEVKEQTQPTAVRQSSDARPADANTFIDSRDNQPYKTITVYGTTWLAENLNYEDRQSSCYNKKPHCKKDGRLYTWHFAKKACPPGTRLPTTEDWERALPADAFESTLTSGTGFRAFNGDFYDYHSTGVYWTAEEKDDYADYAYYFKWKMGSWQKEAFYKDQANSIRCIVEGSKTSGSHTWGDQ